jgi:hypothetical protein
MHTHPFHSRRLRSVAVLVVVPSSSCRFGVFVDEKGEEVVARDKPRVTCDFGLDSQRGLRREVGRGLGMESGACGSVQGSRWSTLLLQSHSWYPYRSVRWRQRCINV